MNLIDNGLDSFKKAFDKLCSLNKEYSEKEKYILKDIILEFHHSFEVLFKDLLSRKDNALLYSDLEKYYNNKFDILINPNKQSQGIHTITFMQAFKRVIISNNIKVDNFCYQNVLKFNDLRNSLTHSETKIEPRQIRVLIANILFNILPILEYISEFKSYIEEKSVLDNLKKIYFIRDEWMLHNIIYLISYINQKEMKDTEVLKYKRSLQDIGYIEIEKSDYNYISENEYILSKFEEEFYGRGISEYSYRKIDKDNPYIMELIAEEEVIELTTINILNRKITYNLSILLSVFDGDDCDFTKDSFKEIESMYNKLSSRNKLNIGLNMKKIENIIEQYESFFNKERRNKKIVNIPLIYSFNKTLNFDHYFYEYSENGKYKFTLTTKYYLETMKSLFNDDNIIFSQDSKFKQYVSTKVENEVENFICSNTWDFFWENLMGSWGDWGTVDNISEIQFYGIDAICDIVSLNEFTIWSGIEIGTEYYTDHEFYWNGSRYLYISLKVYLDEDEEIRLSELKILD